MSHESNLKTALRRLVRSVTVVTARLDGERFAMAATAVCEVSMAPASMLVCINRDSRIFAAIDAGAPFALNILSCEQEPVSRACGGGLIGEERFSVGAWRDLDGGLPPILEEACAAIVLDQAKIVDHGSHRVVIGDVIQVVLPDTPSALAYYDGRYVPVAAASLQVQ